MQCRNQVDTQTPTTVVPRNRISYSLRQPLRNIYWFQRNSLFLHELKKYEMSLLHSLQQTSNEILVGGESLSTLFLTSTKGYYKPINCFTHW